MAETEIQEKMRIAEQNKHIPTAVIEQDIVDTQNEIVVLQREAKGYRLIGDRMSHFRADARESGIKERRDFIKKLEIILETRGQRQTALAKAEYPTEQQPSPDE